MMQQTLKAAPSFKKRAKSVYQQRNLGTIRERKKEKRQEKDVTSGEIIMRILRMRCGWVLACPGNSNFSICRPLGPGHRNSLHISCRSWQQCRPSRSSGPGILNDRSDSDRSKTPYRPFRRCQVRLDT